MPCRSRGCCSGGAAAAGVPKVGLIGRNRGRIWGMAARIGLLRRGGRPGARLTCILGASAPLVSGPNEEKWRAGPCADHEHRDSQPAPTACSNVAWPLPQSFGRQAGMRAQCVLPCAPRPCEKASRPCSPAGFLLSSPVAARDVALTRSGPHGPKRVITCIVMEAATRACVWVPTHRRRVVVCHALGSHVPMPCP